MIRMTSTDLQTAIEGLNPYQIDQVTAQVTKYMKLNDELKQTRPEACPICGKADGQLIKKGFQAGKQRYQCKDCGSKFTYDTKQLTAHSHQPVDPWITMIEDGAAAYNRLANLLECKKVELIGHKSYDRVYHLNTVNNLHSRIKEMLRQFRGVASKYLNRYLALFTIISSFTK